jgi:hypothetical protein
MDPSRRTLLRVNWDDASAADELFTILMGENVEQRRQYIEEHALEVKSLAAEREVDAFMTQRCEFKRVGLVGQKKARREPGHATECGFDIPCHC